MSKSKPVARYTRYADAAKWSADLSRAWHSAGYRFQPVQNPAMPMPRWLVQVTAPDQKQFYARRRNRRCNFA